MDKTQFTAAVLDAEPTLYRVAKAILGNEADCADAAQQAILRGWEQLAPEAHSELYGVLMGLEEKYRLPVTIHYIEGFKTWEIARMLSLPEGIVKTRLRRDRRLLYEDLKD